MWILQLIENNVLLILQVIVKYMMLKHAESIGSNDQESVKHWGYWTMTYLVGTADTSQARVTPQIFIAPPPICTMSY